MAKLVLRRYAGERVRLKVGDQNVWVTFQSAEGHRQRAILCFEASRDVQIDREELLELVEQKEVK